MAVDMFIKIGDIKGESAVDKLTKARSTCWPGAGA